MSIGTFILIRNECEWIAAHLLRILPFIDECVFYDGNSTDGTLEIIKAIRDEHPDGKKIKLFENQDPADLRGEYTRMFNDCMWSLSTDLALFLHPDMFLLNPEKLLDVKKSEATALTTSLRSFAGEPGGQLYEIGGRLPLWKSIYRLRNPDLGAHYYGAYGSAEEDVYYSAITGTEHIHRGHRFDLYPYEVEESGLEILHFSDVRKYDRRLSRMITCLINQGYSEKEASEIAPVHPRVTLKAGKWPEQGVMFDFTPAEYPAEFLEARAKYQHLERKEPALA